MSEFDFRPILGKLAGGADLSCEEMSSAVDAIMRGVATEGEIGFLLIGLKLKGETVDEVAGAAAAMRRHAAPIATRRTGVLDTCGTGGDASGTFNISTAAALVAAAAGTPVAKHGNRRVSSRTGSADVLAELGVNVEADLATASSCLDELGICFCFAPLWHRSMKHVAAVRQKLGVPTIFNMLGPLANPAGAAFQLVGVGRPELRPLLAAALAQLGVQRAIVVHGSDGLDELTLSGPTHVTEASSAGLQEFTWQPEDFGVKQSPLDSLRVSNPAESAAVIRRVLAGESGPARDIVVLNAAAALWVAGRDASPVACASLAAQAIDRGAARELLAALVQKTRI